MQSPMRCGTLRTLKNLSTHNEVFPEEILGVFCMRYAKLKSMVPANHDFLKMVFNSANQKLADFLDALRRLSCLSSQCIVKFRAFQTWQFDSSPQQLDLPSMYQEGTQGQLVRKLAGKKCESFGKSTQITDEHKETNSHCY